MRETNGDVGGGDSASVADGIRNDLSRLVVEITAAAVAVEQARTRRLSPEPLPHVVDPRRLTTEHPGGGVPFALVDLPDQQRQQIRWWEPGVDGSLLIYGADGAGTSAVLASLAVGAAERYPADDFHLYVIDAGALAPLVALPHTGAVVRHDDVDRIARLVRLVGAEIDSRNSTSDGGRRRAVTSNRGSLIPHVVVMIDDVGALRNHLYDRSRRERAGDDNVGARRGVGGHHPHRPRRPGRRHLHGGNRQTRTRRPIDVRRPDPGAPGDASCRTVGLRVVRFPAGRHPPIRAGTGARPGGRRRAPDRPAPGVVGGRRRHARRRTGALRVRRRRSRNDRRDSARRWDRARDHHLGRSRCPPRSRRARPRRGGRRSSDQPFRRRSGGARRPRASARPARATRPGIARRSHVRRGSRSGPPCSASTPPAAPGRSSTRCATSSPIEPASRRRCWSRSKRAGGCSCCAGTTSPPPGLERLLERAGFVDASVEPAPVAFGRVVGITTPVARRDASNGQSWAALYDAGVPIAATSVPQASREYPGIAIATDVTALHRLDEVLAAPELADLVDEMVATAIASSGKAGVLDLRLVLADDPYPPFPAHDLRAPQRQAVALGAAAGAAGLAGRLRPVDVLSPTGAPPVADVRRPWAIERVVDLPPRARIQRLPWWRRRGPLAQSRSRKPGRSPKTATAWRNGTKSRR